MSFVLIGIGVVNVLKDICSSQQPGVACLGHGWVICLGGEDHIRHLSLQPMLNVGLSRPCVWAHLRTAEGAAHRHWCKSRESADKVFSRQFPPCPTTSSGIRPASTCATMDDSESDDYLDEAPSPGPSNRCCDIILPKSPLPGEPERYRLPATQVPRHDSCPPTEHVVMTFHDEW